MFRQTHAFLLGILSLSVAAFGETPVITLAGSSTVTRMIMPVKAGVEAAQNVEIRLIPIASGRGLAELAAGRAQAAMLSGPVDYLLARADARTPTGLRLQELDQLRLTTNAKSEIVALLHPSVPVRTIAAEQLAKILTGALTNWSQVGGPDLPIVLVLPDELDGVRATVATTLLGGRSFAASAFIAEKQADVIARVTTTPGAIGLAARIALAPDSVWAEVEPHLAVPLFLVARRVFLEENPKVEMVLNSIHSRLR